MSVHSYCSRIPLTGKTECKIVAAADGIAFSLISASVNLFPRDIKSNRRNMAKNQRVSADDKQHVLDFMGIWPVLWFRADPREQNISPER